MNREDFFNLKIGQGIYYNNIRYKLMDKITDKDNYKDIILVRLIYKGETLLLDWDTACKECSLATKPVDKEKYWQWIVKLPYKSQPDIIGWYDDNGVNINGLLWDENHNIEWYELNKKKIESIFWED